MTPTENQLKVLKLLSKGTAMNGELIAERTGLSRAICGGTLAILVKQRAISIVRRHSNRNVYMITEAGMAVLRGKVVLTFKVNPGVSE